MELKPIPIKKPIPGWPENLTADNWPKMRKDIQKRLLDILGPFPKAIPKPEIEYLEKSDFRNYKRLKIIFYSEVDDKIPAWLLIPKNIKFPVPGVLVLHASTRGTGKDRVVGIRGRTPSLPPDVNNSYGITMVEAGFVVLAPDVCADGERVPEGYACRDTRPFYKKHPKWSYMGKIIWDNMRAIDILCSLPQVRANKIGIIGHSLGGHSSIFTAGFDKRISVIVANGAVSYWFRAGDPLHWAHIPRDGINTYVERLRPFLTPEKWREIPVAWYEIMSLLAPRPFLNLQAELDPRPVEAENHGGALHIYRMLGKEDRVSFMQYPGRHNFPVYVQDAAVNWFKRWFSIS